MTKRVLHLTEKEARALLSAAGEGLEGYLDVFPNLHEYNAARRGYKKLAKVIREGV